MRWSSAISSGREYSTSTGPLRPPGRPRRDVRAIEDDRGADPCRRATLPTSCRRRVALGLEGEVAEPSLGLADVVAVDEQMDVGGR